MAKTKKRKKPKKPKGSPLTVHPNGQWSKKINGKPEYFGPWDDYEGALKRYTEFVNGNPKQIQDSSSVTLEELVMLALTSKEQEVNSGKVTDRTFQDLRKTGQRMVEFWGRDLIVDEMDPTNFRDFRSHLATRHKSPARLRTEITKVNQFFNFGEKNQHHRPVYKGSEFYFPAKREERAWKYENRQTHGKVFFEAAQIRAILDAANPQMKAMVLLGINCGFENEEIGQLRRHQIKNDGWIEKLRGKTGEFRLCKLWPDTLQAIENYERPDPKDPSHDDRVFLVARSRRPYGHTFTSDGGTRPDPILSRQFKRITEDLGIYRVNLTWKALRKTFQTVAENELARKYGQPDMIAIRLAMGHRDPSISANYREVVEPFRLERVADAVYDWLGLES